jgi:hypothetical protein
MVFARAMVLNTLTTRAMAGTATAGGARMNRKARRERS